MASISCHSVLWFVVAFGLSLATHSGNASHAPGGTYVDSEVDIIIGTEADFADHNYIRDGIVGGFDIEITAAVCAHIAKRCAIITVPWQSVWPSNYSSFGWQGNPLHYPGEGYHNRWFHCSVGTFNLVERQQSIAFTHPYTDSALVQVGFVVRDSGGPSFPTDADGKTVGVVAGWAASTHLVSPRRAPLFRGRVREYAVQSALWAALVSGELDAVFIDSTTATAWLSRNAGYRLMHGTAGWTNGVAYGCHPEYGDVVVALNAGLVAFKQTPAYAELCAKFPAVACDRSSATYANVKTPAHPQIADHPSRRADIVVGVSGDAGEHSHIRNGVLGGFDIELVKGVCARAGKTCALVTLPWEAVWPAAYPRFGWARNIKTYPGEAVQSRWVHCTAGTRHTVARQQSASFTHPYTDRVADRAGLVVRESMAATFPVNATGKTIALVAHTAVSAYFQSQVVMRWKRAQKLEKGVGLTETPTLATLAQASHHHVPLIYLSGVSSPYAPFFSLGRLCQWSPRTVPVFASLSPPTSTNRLWLRLSWLVRG